MIDVMTDITTPWTPTTVTRRARTGRRVPTIGRRRPATRSQHAVGTAVRRAQLAIGGLAPGTSPSDAALGSIGHLERHPR